MKKILIFSCLFLTSFSNAQKHLDLGIAMTEADSIQITSHENLYVERQVPGKDNSYYKKVIENGLPNKSIIKEKINLEREMVTKLANILSVPTKVTGYDDIQCFIPHHSIFIFKSGNCYFLDICFKCKHYVASKELNLPKGFLLANEDWGKLESFFKEQGIKYEMP